MTREIRCGLQPPRGFAVVPHPTAYDGGTKTDGEPSSAYANRSSSRCLCLSRRRQCHDMVLVPCGANPKDKDPNSIALAGTPSSLGLQIHRSKMGLSDSSCTLKSSTPISRPASSSSVKCSTPTSTAPESFAWIFCRTDGVRRTMSLQS